MTAQELDWPVVIPSTGANHTILFTLAQQITLNDTPIDDGALIGAFIGAKMEQASNAQSLKVALGAFVGFLLGTGVKLFYSVYVLYYFTALVLSAYF